MGLRVGYKSPESTNGGASESGANDVSPNSRRVVTKRNTLKDLVAGEVKKAAVNSQHSGESQDLVMSLRGGFAGEEQTNELSCSSTKNLLNTPLANTMKKVGINPQFNNKLNQYVVRKGGPTGTSVMSG